MSKIKNFAKSYKNTIIKSGDRLTLYGNDYTVISSTDSLTLLRDSKGHPCAYPTDKVKSMMLQKSLKKTVVSDKNPNVVSGSEKTARPRTQGSAGVQGGPGKMHAGKIRVDKVDAKGRKYHYWVDAQHGTKHEDHSSDPHEHQLDHKSVEIHTQMNNVINKYAHEEDHGKLKKMLNEFIEAKAAYTHLRDAHNQLAKEQGGFHSSTLQNLSSKQDEADRKFNKLAEAIKQSTAKTVKK